jgi:hypothetical protein
VGRPAHQPKSAMPPQPPPALGRVRGVACGPWPYCPPPHAPVNDRPGLPVGFLGVLHPSQITIILVKQHCDLHRHFSPESSFRTLENSRGHGELYFVSGVLWLPLPAARHGRSARWRLGSRQDPRPPRRPIGGEVRCSVIKGPDRGLLQKTQTSKLPNLTTCARTPFWSFCAGQRRIGPRQVTTDRT